MQHINQTYIKFLLLTSVTIMISGCVKPVLYVEPTDENTANLVIYNKTEDHGRFRFIIYGGSETCTEPYEYNTDITLGGADKSIREIVKMKIKARDDFTFRIKTNRWANSWQACYFSGTFNARKGHTYALTLKNGENCALNVSKVVKGGKLVPETSYYKRWPITDQSFTSSACSEGEWVSPFTHVVK